MSDGPEPGGAARRDAHGRLVSRAGLLGIALAGLVLGLAALLLVDGVLVLLGAGRFGRANGWLAVILPVWLFVEEFRAWRGVPGRPAAGLVAAVLAIALGALGSGLVTRLGADLPLVSGAVGATLATLAYALVWFSGIRWLAGRSGGPR